MMKAKSSKQNVLNSEVAIMSFVSYSCRNPDAGVTNQSGRSPKVVELFLLQTLVAIKYDYFNCMIQSKRNQILVPNLVSFISQNDKNVWFFDYRLLLCSVRRMVLICLMQNIDMCLLYKSHQIARLVSHLINHFSKWMFTVYHKNSTKFGSKNEISHIFLYHQVTSYGNIKMDVCIITFNLNCIMQLMQFYNIATKVSSRKKCYYFWCSTWLLLSASKRRPSCATNKNELSQFCFGNYM